MIKNSREVKIYHRNTDYGGSARGSVLRQGWDGGRYPFPRTYTLGLNFQF